MRRSITMRQQNHVVRGVQLGGTMAWRVVFVVLVAVLCAACGSGVEPEVGYKPTFLPVEFGIGQSGVSVTGDPSLVTPIGEFSIGARYSLPDVNQGDIYVILRDRKIGYDHIYEVKTGGDQFTAVVNGTTTVSIVNSQVTIDITSGTIDSVRFRTAPQQISEESGGSLWRTIVTRWDAGWQQSWYRPYVLTRWAYDDSTIEKWYGIGFIWFLLRLLLAIILAMVDTVLSLGFLLGQVGFLIFGPTGRDLIYGLLVLGALGIGVIIARY